MNMKLLTNEHAYNAEMAAKGRATPCMCGVSIGVVKDHDPGCPAAFLGECGRQKLAREIVELARQTLGDIGCYCPDDCLSCALEKKLELLDAMGGCAVSGWTHSICAPCWNAMHASSPERQAALDKEVGDDDLCCWCEQPHASGIYLRQAPGAVRCGGRGGTHEPGQVTSEENEHG